MPKTSFDQILEMIDNLSLDEQKDLINIAQIDKLIKEEKK